MPRSQRYRAYVAGLAWDTFAVSILILVLSYVPIGVQAHAILEAMILLVGLGMTQQLLLYMRTDLYFVALDLFRCGNLFEDALAYLRFRLRPLTRALSTEHPETDPRRNLPRREQKIVTFYAYCVAIGSSVALGIYALYGLPIIARLVVRAAHEVANGIAENDVVRAADGLLALSLQAAMTILFVVTFVRTHPWTRIGASRLAGLRRALS